MKSVDKLRMLPRHGTNGFGAVVTANEEAIEAIADEIEAETEEMKAFCERIEKAAKAREELEVFGTAYMPLPLDADGVSIRVGDKLRVCDFTIEVAALTKSRVYYWDKLCECNWTHAINCHHVKPRTLEDVLADFAADVENDRNTIETARKYADEIRELLGVEE